MSVSDDVILDIARRLLGERYVPVVQALLEGGSLTDEEIAQRTSLSVEEVRGALFRLEGVLLTQHRSREAITGWYEFRWTINRNFALNFIKSQKRQILKRLEARLEYERSHQFYYCGTEGCTRVTFDQAVDLGFRCPVCGRDLSYFDNTPVIEELERRVERLKRELRV